MDPGGCKVFPDDSGLVGDFKDPRVRSLSDQCVSVGESLCGTHHGAVEPMVFRGSWEPEVGGILVVLPDDIQGYRVQFDNTGGEPDESGHPEVPVS